MHCMYLHCSVEVVVAGNARKNREGVVSRSVIYFTHHVPQLSVNSPEPLKLRKILDMVSFCVEYHQHNPSMTEKRLVTGGCW